MLELVATGNFDAFLCGDDAITRAVMQKALPRLKVVSKYGIGLDKVDVKAATDLKVPVCYCPGVNHTTVAEHAFGLLLAIYVIGSISNYIQVRTMGGVGRRVLFNLRNSIFNKLESLPVAFFNQNKAGDLISRINSDTDKRKSFVTIFILKGNHIRNF